jgi:hypothetical protein
MYNTQKAELEGQGGRMKTRGLQYYCEPGMDPRWWVEVDI